MLFAVVLGFAGFFQSRDLGKKAIIDGKVFQVRTMDLHLNDVYKLSGYNDPLPCACYSHLLR